MFQACIYGRLGGDAKAINTKTGKPMAVASIAVNVGSREQEEVLWLKILCFGKLAQELAAHRKGETISASGRIQINHWTTNDGQQREDWELVVDTFVSARTVRPGRKPAATRDLRTQDVPAVYTPGSPDAQASSEPPPFDDELPF